MTRSAASALRCPVCGADAQPFLTSPDRNRRVDAVKFSYNRCTICQLVFLVDPPEDLARYYGDEYYRQPTLDEMQRVADREHYQIEMVTDRGVSGRLVEIGPAWGTFSLEARTAGFDVTAIEMDATCCSHLEAVVGVGVVQSDRPQDVLPDLAPFDVVAMWQVIEHLPDPWAVMEAAGAALAPGGLLVVATPNPQSFGLRWMRSRWPHLDAPRHLWLIPLDLLRREASHHGLELVGASFDDPGARSWNRFAWQRLFMNEMPGRTLSRLAFVLGAALSLLAAPVERRHRGSSSYTAIFRKTPSE